MAGSRAAKSVDEDKSPGWMEPSTGREEEMHDETYRDECLRRKEEKRGILYI
jgi:hypothetical protein